MKIIAIANLKGGVGKTTITHNLAGVLAERGKRVLLIDMDHQANLTSIYAGALGDHENNGVLLKTLVAKTPISDIIVPTGIDRVALVPADLDLALIDAQFAADLNAHFLLADLLETQSKNFQYALIDCPPNLGLGTRMALVAAHEYLVPLDAHHFSFKGAQRLEGVVSDVRKRANRKLRCAGYVMNRVHPRRKLSDENIDLFKERFGEDLFSTQIRESVKYQEASTSGVPITSYQPTSEWAELFRELANELHL